MLERVQTLHIRPETFRTHSRTACCIIMSHSCPNLVSTSFLHNPCIAFEFTEFLNYYTVLFNLLLLSIFSVLLIIVILIMRYSHHNLASISFYTIPTFLLNFFCNINELLFYSIIS